jgi:hypothetical protein
MDSNRDVRPLIDKYKESVRKNTRAQKSKAQHLPISPHPRFKDFKINCCKAHRLLRKY